jgi:hypothetical protein
MDVVAGKILKDYMEPIKDTMQLKKDGKLSQSSSSESRDSQSDKEDMKNNDFHIDRDRLKAAIAFEKREQQWARFDPD